MKLKSNKKESNKNFNVRVISWFFILIFTLNILYIPSNAFAGGPTQPEVQSFAPIGMDDMVNPFTGDFSYNIPLMEIEGYPLNINYNAGITMDQEASWVGLGWNLNVGEVVRNLRGIPDDFDGDEIITEKNLKDNKTYSLDFGSSIEIVAFDQLGSIGVNSNTAVSFNNYSGWAVEKGFGLNISSKLSKDGAGRLSAGLSISGSSENGASFRPSASLSVTGEDADARDVSLGGNIGASFNSRSGLQQISYGFSMDDPKIMNSLVAGQASYNFGTTNFSPAVQTSMQTINFSGNFKLGFDAYTVDPTASISISFSKQFIPEDLKISHNPAYGYFNLNKGQENEKALLDFTRDNDGSFTKDTPFLPSTSLTSDIFSVRAQGIGGSFKGFRDDIGYVFDPMTTNTMEANNIGFEAGLPALFKASVDINQSKTYTENSAWNDVTSLIKEGNKFRKNTQKINNFSLIEANDFSVDRDNFFSDKLNNDLAVKFRLSGFYDDIKLGSAESMTNVASNTKMERTSEYPKNVLLQILTIGDLKKGFGINEYRSGLITTEAKDHHIGEMIYLGNDGKRYVFDIPAYNTLQEDVTFAVGSGLNGGGPTALTPNNDYIGVITYPSSAASKDNDFGVDGYYNSRTTPAYAHSFMLSSVLTDDYIDNDSIKGPSKNDFGNYVKFNYMKVGNFGWRNPASKEASFNEGLKSINSDDKASFIYGAKELMYVTSIESKNYIIVFTLSDRADLRSVSDRNGGTNSLMGKRIDRIDKYSRIDYELNGVNATPIQSVHFEYSYNLCPGNPTSQGGAGKLTLDKLYFTYQGSNKMKYSPYEFYYGNNKAYNLKALDRWGTFSKLAGGNAVKDLPLSSPLTNFDFPYTTQNRSLANQYAAAWCMNQIKLPSGGKIVVEYEADDYRYVQNKRANRMFKIVGVEEGLINSSIKLQSVSDDLNKNRRIYFEMLNGYDNIQDYVGDLEGGQLYFRTLTEMRGLGTDDPTNFEYISGYGKIFNSGIEVINGVKYGWIKFKGESLKDGEGGVYSPITKAAIQFGRLYLNEYINDVDVSPSGDDTENGLLDLANAVLNSIASFTELFVSPNLKIWTLIRGRKIVSNKSWIRLVDPTEAKIGGGHRVKRILMYDNWNAMTGEDNFTYGQEYSYKLENGKSSGVAENEPMIGADESPLRQPYFYNNIYRFAPDNNLYTDTKPFESQFPSPNVGYERVVIKNLTRPGVVRTATGKVIKEYYTAKDFPFSVHHTDIDPRPYKKTPFFGESKDMMHVSQGFTIITNDMHGKEKKNTVYGENSSYPISSVEYIYQTDDKGLDNQVKIINRDGSIEQHEIGVRREAVADLRKSETVSSSFNINMNVNGVYIFVPITIPIPIPKRNQSKILFKSATLNKQVQKFGILKKTIAQQDGAEIQTNNLVYDANTGKPLITQTINNFTDSIYNVTYPAYWKYEEMGMAYKNLGIYKKGVNINNGNLIWNNASATFVEGDELALVSGSTNTKGWVIKVEPDMVWIMDKDGTWITMGNATMTIIRSGRKNKQTEPMATLTAMSNPIPRIQFNNYSKVLNASAIEFSQDWDITCECLPPGKNAHMVNPYMYGLKGHWRPSKSFTYLTNRTQSNYNGNTNIKADGVFSTYTPYYFLNGNQWMVNPANWTFTSEVTQFSSNGNPIETKDAIGRYSSSIYSFNHTLQTSAAVNASLRQQLNLHFEDDESSCGSAVAGITPFTKSTESHTGRNSIEVLPSHPVVIKTNDFTCGDSPECNLDLRFDNGKYVVDNSRGEINFEYSIIYGSPVIGIDDNEIIITNTSSEDYEVQFKISDENGCHLMESITFPQ